MQNFGEFLRLYMMFNVAGSLILLALVFVLGAV